MNAVGQNAQYVLSQKDDVIETLTTSLVRGDQLATALGNEAKLSAATFDFKQGQADRCRVSVGMNEQKQTLLDINGHFEVRGTPERLAAAIDTFHESLEIFAQIAEQFQARFLLGASR